MVAVAGKVVAVTRAACAGLSGVGLARHQVNARVSSTKTNIKTNDVREASKRGESSTIISKKYWGAKVSPAEP